jgi:inosine triphosphate pyrophosphatase
MTTLEKLNFITSNKGKLAEVKAILGSVIDVGNQAVDVPEIQGTIEEIARAKCRHAAEVVRPCDIPSKYYFLC